MLLILLVSLWSLSYYASHMLRQDMERLLGEQQLATASLMASEINQDLEERFKALATLAELAAPIFPGHPAVLQTFLERHPVTQLLFNGGLIAHGLNGAAIADAPQVAGAGRIGVNYRDMDHVAAALKEGKSTIGRPVMGRTLKMPVIGMSVPVRNTQGQVIGALTGVVNLGKPNFLDHISQSSYGKTGSYQLIAPQHGMIVTASDKRIVMESLSAPGAIPLFDRFRQGDEGSGITTNPRGVEILVSAKTIPVAGWLVSVAQPTADAFSPIATMQQHMVQATLLLTLLAGVFVWWATRRQLKPLVSAVAQLAAMSGETSYQSLRFLPTSRPDETGQLIGGFNRLLVSLMDRTDALKQSESFKQAILNSVTVEIAVLDRNGVILAVNQPWRRFAQENGIAPEQATRGMDIGVNYLAACRGDAIALAASDGIRAVLDGRLPCFQLEYPCHAPQQARWFSMTVTPLNPSMQSGVVISHEDISARKLTYEHLRIAATAFESQEGIVVMNAKKTILQVNQAFTHITGFSQQEAMGKTTAILRSTRHPASFYEDAWEVIRSTGAWKGEAWQRRKNGEDYPARIILTAVKNEADQVTHYVGHFTDETVLYQQEQQRLRHEAALRNTLVREVHHRVKNNLQGITGLLHQFAQQHPETSVPINQAIGQVQGISVIYGLQGRSDTSSVYLCELIQAIADGVQTLWQTPVPVDISHIRHAFVIVEREAVPIALILNELMVNAVKHGGKAPGHVSVCLGQGPQPDAIRIMVCNSGQLRVNSDDPSADLHGLRLVKSLMPRLGASLSQTQQGDRVITVLELSAPVIYQDMMKPP